MHHESKALFDLLLIFFFICNYYFTFFARLLLPEACTNLSMQCCIHIV